MNHPMIRLAALGMGMAALSASAAPPAAPTALSVAPLGTSAQVLHWTDNSADETGFTIDRLDGASWTPVTTAAADATRIVLNGQPAGIQTYRVSASNGDGTSSPCPQAATLRMNVLFFLADDMGYLDIVANRNPVTDGPTIYETPALDTLKSQSVNFTQAYCSGPKCVVARRAIQTGMYDFRDAAVATGGGIGPEMTTIGEAMQSGGYRTCFIGKWHLGGELQYPLTSPVSTPVYKTATPEASKVPAAQGYDVSIAAGEYGAPPLDIDLNAFNPQTSGYYPSVVAGSSPTQYWYGLPDLYASSPTEYLTDRLTTEATGFIGAHVAANPAQPFFLTLAHYAVHTPLQADPSRVAYFEAKKTSMAAAFAAHPGGTEFIQDYTSNVRQFQDNTIYAAMMDSFDDSLANIRSYLAATDDPRNPGKKLADTTILILSSDHGGKSTHAVTDPNDEEIPTSNYPLRQGKTWCYEGGLRIPLMVYWPGINPAGSAASTLVNGADLYTSILDMTGTARVPAQHLDSQSFAEAVAVPTTTTRAENFHWFTNADDGTGNPALGAYRKGEYKMVYHMIRRITELYKLDEDPSERNNIASIRPDLAAEMLAKLIAKRDEVGVVPVKPGTNSWNTELLVVAPVITIPPLPDGPPSGLTASAVSGTAIDLTWVDGSTNEERFVIQRKVLGGGAFNEVATAPANARRFRDTGLTPGTSYQYRIQAETLAGWNGPSNQLTVATPSTGTLPVIARGDLLTTLINETRVQQPLVNDQGENLVITAITQPAKGTATIVGGTSIRFVPTIGATGDDTMTYTVTGSGGSATGFIQLAILPNHSNVPVAPVFDLTPTRTTTLVDAWEFNEANNTTLTNCVNSAPGATLKFTGATPKTNGAGALNVITTGAAGTNTYRTTGSVSPGAKTLGASNAGTYELSVRFAAASLTGGDADGAYASASMRDGTASIDLFAIRLQEVGGNLQLQFRNAGSSLLQSFTGNVLADAIEVRAEANLVSKLVTVYVKVGAGTEINKGSFPIDPAAATWNDYRIAALNNSTDFGPSDFITIDYLRIKSVVVSTPPSPTPSEYHAAWWYGVEPADAALRAAGSDPDGDGIKNIMEFAFGANPASGSSRGALFPAIADTLSDPDSLDELVYTLPVRAGANFAPDAITNAQKATVDGVRYSIEASTDLGTFTTPVEEVYPAMESGLPPVSSGWQYRSFRMPASNGTSTRGFMRAKIEEVP